MMTRYLARGRLVRPGLIAGALLLASCAPKPPETRLPAQPPMVYVPGGTYRVGRDDGPENERPSHLVQARPFYIDKYEVTNRMYLAFIRATGYPAPKTWLPDSTILGKEGRFPFNEQDADLPVTWVSWSDAVAYARWRGCRLPTEVEWEVAARCSSNFAYPWGDSARADGAPVANIAGAEDGYDLGPAAAGSFPHGRSCRGAEDMAGNVWEWVYDWYLPAAWQRQAALGPATVMTDSLFGQRVIRGGSWFDPISYARTTTRAGFDPDYGSDIIGFRCARDGE